MNIKNKYLAYVNVYARWSCSETTLETKSQKHCITLTSELPRSKKGSGGPKFRDFSYLNFKLGFFTIFWGDLDGALPPHSSYIKKPHFIKVNHFIILQKLDFHFTLFYKQKMIAKDKFMLWNEVCNFLNKISGFDPLPPPKNVPN